MVLCHTSRRSRIAAVLQSKLHPKRTMRVGSKPLIVHSSTAHPRNRRGRDASMADRQLILGVFSDELAADNAAVAMKDSGIADGDAIGILALDSGGKLKQDKVGKR